MAINGHYLTSAFGHAHLNLSTLLAAADTSAPPPLHLTVLSNSSETVRLSPSATGGLGFHIRGSSPVVIHGVDKGMCASPERERANGGGEGEGERMKWYLLIVVPIITCNMSLHSSGFEWTTLHVVFCMGENGIALILMLVYPTCCH